jgi:IS5 family transposase
MRRRAAVEPVIGHIKAEHRTAITSKDATATASNAVLASAGYNFSLLLRWLERLCAP